MFLQERPQLSRLIQQQRIDGKLPDFVVSG
jgi:hypothetical protein